eukprot:5590169-Ditylum_brightwellii.AAC.1
MYNFHVGDEHHQEGIVILHSIVGDTAKSKGAYDKLQTHCYPTGMEHGTDECVLGVRSERIKKP